MSDIGTLREASRRLGSLGSSANARLALGPYAEALGVEVKGLSDLQVFQSVTDKLAPTLREAGSGTVSDADLKGFQRAIGVASNNPVARERILDTLEAAARNQMASGAIARDLATKKITRAEAEDKIQALPSPMEGFRQFRKDNPDPGAPQEVSQTQQPKMPTGNKTEQAVFINQSRANAAAAIKKAPAAREVILQRLKDAGVSTDGL